MLLQETTTSKATLLCTLNRDPLIPLCGGCIAGYSEVYGSTVCLECFENHYEYILIGIGIGLLYAIFISFIIHRNGDSWTGTNH